MRFSRSLLLSLGLCLGMLTFVELTGFYQDRAVGCDPPPEPPKQPPKR